MLVAGTVVSRIEFDVNRYQAVLVDLPEWPDELLSFDGHPRLPGWTPVPVYSDQPHLERPDIWHLVGASVLVMDRPTIEKLEPFIARAGELLPLEFVGGDEELLALNVLVVRNVLEPGSYQLDELECPARFVEHRLPDTGFFKIPEFATADIFCVERDDDDDSVSRRLELRDVRGITLERVWSSEAGPSVTNLFLA